ncbi:cytochrome C oxidase subunit IV family protein [Risungbinella massiliensis]|uniref:cytochrome C oxidase subunit IV family protein n=1 Tax=Risungbinella massiliensis TaxID=1329796 RepID=UPI0005CB9B69|nr:cytochrome C oxidase subunit IV family protein [Risungbinella massiliensis]
MTMDEKPVTNTGKAKSGTVKHLLSFAVMIVLTVAAFYLVAVDVVPKSWILPLLLVFALIQVLLQFFTFMHLDQKGSLMYVIFIFSGLLIAVVSAVGMVLMEFSMN